MLNIGAICPISIYLGVFTAATVTDRPTAVGLTEAVRELVGVCRKASMSAEGRVSSLEERVTGSKPGSTHLHMTADLPVSEELERTIRRVCDVYRHRIDGASAGLPRDQGAERKAQAQAVLAEVGLDATAVAFIYGMTTESVRRLRGRHGRDPDTGQRSTQAGRGRIDGKPIREAPLTAPASAALERLEEREADGEVGTP